MGQGGSKPLKSENSQKIMKGLYKYDSGKCKDKLSGRKYRTADTTGWVLQKIYGVPDRYVGAYPKYTLDKATADLKACALGGALRYSRDVVRFDKLTKGEDERKFALKSIHGWTQREVDERGLFARLPYSMDMARKDIATIRRGGGKPRYTVTRGTSEVYDTKAGIMYSALTGGYVSGFEYTVGKNGKVNPSGIAPQRKVLSQYGLVVRDGKGTTVPRGSDLFAASWSRPFTALRALPCGTFGLRCRSGQTSVTIEDTEISAAIRAILVLAKDRRPSAAKQWDAIDRIAKESERKPGSGGKPGSSGPSAPPLTEALLQQFGLGPKNAGKTPKKKSSSGGRSSVWLSSRGSNSPPRKNLNSAHGAFYTGLFKNSKNGRLNAFLANAARAGAPPGGALNAGAGNARKSSPAKAPNVPGQPISPSQMVKLTSSQQKRVSAVAAAHAALTNAQKLKYKAALNRQKKSLGAAKTVEQRVKRGEMALDVARGGFDPKAKPRSAGKAEDKEVLARAGLLHPTFAGIALNKRANVGLRDAARVKLAQHEMKRAGIKDETIALVYGTSLLKKMEDSGYTLAEIVKNGAAAKYYADLKKKAAAEAKDKSVQKKVANKRAESVKRFTNLRDRREKLEAEYKKSKAPLFGPDKKGLNEAAKAHARQKAPSPSSPPPRSGRKPDADVSVTADMIKNEYEREYKRLAGSTRDETRKAVKAARATHPSNNHAARVAIVHLLSKNATGPGQIKDGQGAKNRAAAAARARAGAGTAFRPASPYKHRPASPASPSGLDRVIRDVGRYGLFGIGRSSPSRMAAREVSPARMAAAPRPASATIKKNSNDRAEGQRMRQARENGLKKLAANRQKSAERARRAESAARKPKSANARAARAAAAKRSPPKAAGGVGGGPKAAGPPRASPARKRAGSR
jgi:hypothetical protein